ncbi:hypothetical protein [Dehalogenimonas etheniformans]|uniref:YokE-like PH domain-containing protein n=1 Tax=Dehalogenimonas etheniformans TaxID=1536648 RepID=A0A2P5P4R4_9CHLR|nr:hypothetical protein [Dehalogenimonas etheniformans]PPD57284.1 hypothetical protein JP09_009545 [Dehalogenimonas etheniformans]QNT77000.1 hypothetical protein HX448_10100 [Dehalogenimonas etheniformans]
MELRDAETATEQLLTSGIVSENENVIHYYGGSLSLGAGWSGGYAFITEKRLIFGRQAQGWSSRGIDLIFECELGDILSVSTNGWFDKRANFAVKQNGQIVQCTLSSPYNIAFAQSLIESKRSYKEKRTVVANTIIIEEAKKEKEKASEILQKRLARGEISLEEFHQKIQRT